MVYRKIDIFGTISPIFRYNSPPIHNPTITHIQHIHTHMGSHTTTYTHTHTQPILTHSHTKPHIHRHITHSIDFKIEIIFVKNKILF